MNWQTPGSRRPLPLILLTGFLGSGKTSLLRHWLAHPTVPLTAVAVIVNDFGTVNVDAALLKRRTLELRQITGGCVCCQSEQELIEQVALLAKDPAIALVWIETSGLAEPEEVLDALSAPELQGLAYVRQTILVLDASDFPCSWRGLPVQREQLRYADRIVLNKIDQVAPAKLDEIERLVQAANPAAPLLRAQRGMLDPAQLGLDESSGHDPAGETAPPSNPPWPRPPRSPDEDAHLHDRTASTLFLPLPEAIPRAAFTRFVAELPRAVFRAKGFVVFTEEPERLYTFQQVRDQTEILLLPLERNPDHATGVVLIGPHLDEPLLRREAARLGERIETV